ncbi:MAG: hypothetical protein HS115_03035 [Spirochaetales bacterium]|nr:hypothetical protein [Spirochaetales bacterium]
MKPRFILLLVLLATLGALIVQKLVMAGLFVVLFISVLVLSFYFDLERIARSLTRVESLPENLRGFFPWPEFARVAAIVRSMVEKQRREKDAQIVEKNLLASLLENLEFAILCLDAQGRIVYASSRLPADLCQRARSGDFFYVPVKDAALLESIDRRLSGQRTEKEERIRTRDHHYRITWAALPEPGDLFLCIIYDETESEQARIIRQQFVQNASHELKTPITSIRGYTELLENRVSGQAELQFIASIKRNVERMTGLIEDMTSIARLEGHEAAFSPSWFLVAPFLERMQALAFGFLALRNQTLRMENDLTELFADETLLEHLLLNLLSNASRYSPEKSFIDVRLKREHNRFCLEVIDCGEGVPDALKGRVFERFFRVDPDRSRKAGGTGLGLSIVRRIVLLHGGEIQLSDAKIQGTHVTVRWPIPLPVAPFQ